MKIRIIKEKKNMYFAEVVGEDGICAQGETAEKVLEYLADVYKNIMEIRQERTNMRKNTRDTLLKGNTSNLLGKFSFKSIEFAI